ncbi:hypothetical protein CU098_006100 [Rhizopus stolonifer]|uniref:Zn(2)-C6 fungal-type domain-containing protein n=1 Tax=Rhizopus stolonifer TaxID=4846 RepID=A0A367KL67_RHIST|nr:hypothetical protein CU098_006100 [Rhizopus stolonifer]
MSDSSNENEREKQTNLGAACFRCRGFRHACDREKPSCSRCYRRGITCVYPEAAPTLKKLQKATETLGDRIKKFNERLRLTEDTMISTYSDDELEEEERPKRRIRRTKVASTSNFSVYPCSKCFKDLQQCDLSLPKCSRCEANNFECHFKKTEPKANHVSQVLNTMNKVMDQWQDSIDRMAKDFAQKTRDFSARANNSLRIKPIHQTSWKITTTKKGLSVESNVSSYHDFSTLVDQFKRSFTVSKDKHKDEDKTQEAILEFDDARSIHTSSSFAVWNSWAHPLHAMPQDYPIEITQELTDNLIDLYCRTPCCSSMRLPIIDTAEFLTRYRDPDVSRRPSTVLIYAICAMAARNAFQLHLWSKRPSFEAPQYNMGKALSIAYCLRGRELLSECFDEPSYESCQAAFLLSYCNYQNGYAGVIYFYEWIAYNMAQELGLYNPSRTLNRYEAMLVWQIYYCNAWYKALQGGESSSPAGLSQCRPHLSTIPPTLPVPKSDEDAADYYVWNAWVYLIRLQVLREQAMATLLYGSSKRSESMLQDIFSLQNSLKTFYQELPDEWKSTDTAYSPCCSETDVQEENKHYRVDLKSFSRHCIDIVRLHYSINQVILYQAFIPMHRVPSTPVSIQSLETSLNAANNITHLLEVMINQRQECYVPLVGFLFANVVYRKLLSYTTDDQCYETGRMGLLRSLKVIKNSINYMYDFELTRSLANVMEQDIQHIICQQATAFDSSVSTSVHSPPTPSSQQYMNEDMFGKPDNSHIPNMLLA